MKKGEYKEIFEDWLTQKKSEGIAKLIKQIDEQGVFWDGENRIRERWLVKFDDGVTVERLILV
jgi:hypothetical protein